MANNKNKSNYLLYAVLAIAFICGVLGVIAFVWEMNGKCKKTSKTTGKGSGSGSGPDGYVENFRQSPYKIKEKFDLSQGTGAWSAASTITNGTGSDVCNADNLPDKSYLVQQNVMTDTGANSKDYTCREFTLDSGNKVSGQGWFVGCQRPSDMLAPLYVAVANDCDPEGNVSNAAAFTTGTCAGVSNTTDATGGVTIEKIANYFGRINSSGTGIDQTTLNQFTNSLDTHVAIWNATLGSYNDQGTPHANNNQKLQASFKQYSVSPNRWVKYYVMTDGNYFASDTPLKADFSPYDTVPSEMAMPNNASWEPQSVTSIGSTAKTAIETDPDVTPGSSQIQNIKNENVTYAQFQQAFRKMLYADGTGAYSADACLGSSVGSS